MSSGPGSSGKPWPRLMALLSRASLRHRLEDRDGKVGEDLVHGSHGSPVSRRSWSAIPRPSSPRCRPPDACHREGPPPAPPATPSPSACRSGRQKPPACPWDRESPPGRKSRAERPRHPDRLPRRPHSARGRRPADSVPPPSPSRHLPASNRAPDGPPRIILPTTCLRGPVAPPAGAKVASRAAKIKRCKRLNRPPNRARPPQAYSPQPFSGQKLLSSSARRLPAFADRSPCSPDGDRSSRAFELASSANGIDAASTHQPFSRSSNAAPTPCPANSGAVYSPPDVAANGAPSGHHAVRARQPIFPAREAFAPFRTGVSCARPRLRFCNGHSWRRQLKDRSSSNLEEIACVPARRQTVNGSHRHLPRVILSRDGRGAHGELRSARLAASRQNKTPA